MGCFDVARRPFGRMGASFRVLFPETLPFYGTWLARPVSVEVVSGGHLEF